jgi:uncharacterized membrane protein YhaH (DUF805 family)
MPPSFDIKLTGKPLPGHLPEIVAKGLASLMKISPERAAGLLAGRETTIKRNLDADHVPRYLQTIEGIGAEVRADRIAEPAPVPAPAAPSQPAGPAELSLVPMAASTAASPDSMKCPACGAEQPKRNLCRECGADMPRMLAAQEEAKRQLEQESPAASPYAPPTASVRDVATYDAEPVTPPPFGLSFEGRVGRVRYLAYGLPVYVPLIIGAILAAIFMGSRSMVLAAIFGITGFVVTLIMALRVAVLRLHDLNLSGRWLFLPIVVGGLATLGGPTGILFFSVVVGLGSLALLLLRGKDEVNDYGPPAGPNTVWTTLGAVLVIALGVLGNAASPDRFMPKDPAPSVEEQAE